MKPPQVVDVRIVGIPIDLWREASAHQESIQREFAIIRAGPASIPNRLLALIDQFQAAFGPYSDPTWDELRAAAERGEKTKDLVFTVPREAAPAARTLESMLDEVDEYCRDAHLVSLATPEPFVSFRRWFLAEFTRQIELGLPPVPWEASVTQDTQSNDSTIDFESQARDIRVAWTDALDLSTASGLRNIIQGHLTAGAKKLTIDLSQASFVDSVGIGLLVTTHNRLESVGGALEVIASPMLKELLELTGLSGMLSFSSA